MEKKKDRSRHDRRRESPPPMPEGTPSQDLVEAARSFGAVAREAYDNCEKGVDADAELRRRRNRSGQ